MCSHFTLSADIGFSGGIAFDSGNAKRAFSTSSAFAGLFKYDKGLVNTFLKLIFSVSFIYVLGLIWLGTLIGWDKPIFKLGAEPFLLAELFKMLLLLFLTPTLLKAKKLIKIT